MISTDANAVAESYACSVGRLTRIKRSGRDICCGDLTTTSAKHVVVGSFADGDRVLVGNDCAAGVLGGLGMSVVRRAFFGGWLRICRWGLRWRIVPCISVVGAV